jgi:hypothetical protein
MLALLLLALSVAGLGDIGGAADAGPGSLQAVIVGQAGGDSGGSMAMRSDCPTCPTSGACIASESTQPVSLNGTAAHPRRYGVQFLDETRPPDTAPPKRFSV